MPLIWLFLTIISLSLSNAWHENSTHSSELHFEVCHYQEEQKSIVQRIDLLESSVENLKEELKTFNIKIDRIFGELKATVAEISGCDIPTAIKANESYFNEQVIDVRWGLSETSNTTIFKTATKKLEQLSNIPSSCVKSQNGIQLIEIPKSKINPFYIPCIEDKDGSGDAWMLIQRRIEGKTDFYRNWNLYRKGFGNLENEFFIGLDKLHAITQHRPHELWIHLQDFTEEKHWAKYSWFAIGNESNIYALEKLGRYSGTVGDSLTTHLGHKFSTKDVDNDLDDEHNCAQLSTGAWWYGNCTYKSNLNGKYYGESFATLRISKGIDWVSWHGYYYSLKYVHMAIRPVK